MGIGFGELVVIALVAIFVVGPERLPKLSRGLAQIVKEWRSLAGELTEALEKEEK
jgi:Tat protein translocase TatB subunit